MSRIKFQISYRATFGQEVCLCGSIAELGNFDESAALKLSCEGEIWSAEIETKNVGQISYFYLVSARGATVRKEWGECRKLQIEKSKNFFVSDFWKNVPHHSYLHSSLFTETIFGVHKIVERTPKYFPNSILLNVACPFVRRGQRLVISGEIEQLGAWDLSKAPALDFVGNGEWQILLNAKNIPNNAQYKFVIVSETDCKAIYWEEGDNRVLPTIETGHKNSVSVEAGLCFRYDSFSFNGTGTAIPVFSLRSDASCGIGDFLDLKKLIDWAAVTNQQLIQLLPINDTSSTQTRKDSYPYSAISCYALHPIYLGISDYPLRDKAQMKLFRKDASALNKLPCLDYEKVLNLKKRYTELLFEQEKESVFASESYRNFYKKNSFWLFSYTAYCYLRDKFATPHFAEWQEFSVYDEEKLQQLVRNNREAKNATDYYSFLQFLLDKQLNEVRQYAQSKGIGLKGDIPIGVNRDSVDAWTSPSLFNMDAQTGAPPDDFSVFGQNWGFPTYNWAAMEREGYDWWKRRFRKMEDYFDAYRIDHILGFFRIWEIPLHSVQGLLGHFSPALPYLSEELIVAGIPFDEERMTKPFIREASLLEIFGKYAREATEKYLIESNNRYFCLKNECDTQRKIQHLFSDKTDERNRTIRDGLYALCNEVLFVRNRENHNRFHPRIAAHLTHSYQYLNEDAKEAFDRLYIDFYYRRHNHFWREQAMTKLPQLVSCTAMLACGEDLGMVPDCVPLVMRELQILSLEIETMPKKSNVAFTDLASLPYLSVCSTSTHDMSPIRLRWTENRAVTQKYYNEALHHEGEAPERCSPELCRQIIQAHLHSPAMWVVIPWQDWMSISGEFSRPDAAEERINIPSDPNHYWCYRMHISLDDLLKEEKLNSEIGEMAKR